MNGGPLACKLCIKPLKRELDQWAESPKTFHFGFYLARQYRTSNAFQGFKVILLLFCSWASSYFFSIKQLIVVILPVWILPRLCNTWRRGIPLHLQNAVVVLYCLRTCSPIPQDAHCYLVLDIGPQQSVLIFIGVISEIFSSLVV